jgi:hypothetical protein
MGITQQIGASSLIKPGVCTSSTRPASPYAGQTIFETDTNKTLVWNGTAWIITNSPYINHAASQIFTGFTKGNATIVSRYVKEGNFVHFWGRCTLGSTSSMSGPLDINLPIPITAASTIVDPVGSVNAYNGTSIYVGHPINLFGGDVRLVWISTSGNYAVTHDTSATLPFTWAAGHYFMWNFFYEAA